jgi:hypothetical protein
MPVNDAKHAIKSAIEGFQAGNLSHNAINLFKALGYNTERRSPFEKQKYESFKSLFVDDNSRFNEEKAIVVEWKYVDLLFQISHEEITKQYSAFKKEVVAKEDGSRVAIESFLFFAIELKNESYSRSALSHITREINKLFPMPAVILFKHGLSLTLAVINRRLHKRDESKDVLEKVTLIKDINIVQAHRAHIEILFDLSFDELRANHKCDNFVELYDAWQKTLDTKELNKRFYKELSNWYFWAIEEVYFPGAALHADKNSLFKEEDKEKEHNAKNLIRLLTRLLFVWFVKEKGLIPEEFFDEAYIADELLVNFKPKKDCAGSLSTISCYYRAILQNLFFATLNQNMGKREFRKPGQHMNVTNLMRYERYFKDPTKYIRLVEKKTPFMNGGLFECLDSPDPRKRGKQGGDVIIYQDGFSDRDDNQLEVPDYIFFGTEDHVDLSEAYGDEAKEYKNAEIKGLINILKAYKFTVAENTPLEEEVALDPELLGRVFENLLASYNPETKTTARKQTGSFYTPREIVNYMADESLIAYLNQKLTDAGIKDKEESLRDLISYSENPNPFNKKETAMLISAIDSSKICDPACGSGAFPVGVLHKLVHILHKLDPRNELWKQIQIEKAQAQDDSTIRDQLIGDIEAAFETNELDYGRKLYLIENCIYGVDIQPIATQISKLRFFISLIVEQKVDIKKENYGVRPLPNLETKFVTANTLIGIQKPEAQKTFGSAEVKALEEKLRDIRHRLFSAKTPTTKRKLREDDKLIREQMGATLIKSGWGNESAKLLASWDPYDQNNSSPFFDPEWMFGIIEGFDVVIGNPPYVDSENMVKNAPEFRDELKLKYTTAKGNWDLFVVFVERGLKLVNTNGCLSFIVPNKIISAKYTEALREYLNTKNVQELIDYSSVDVFKEVAVYPIVFRVVNNKRVTPVKTKVMKSLSEIENENLVKEKVFYSDIYWDKYFFDINVVNIIAKLSEFKKLGENDLEVVGSATVSEAYEIKEVIRDLDNQKKFKKFINTGTIDPFRSLWGTKRTQYIKAAYQKPIVQEDDLISISKTRFQQACSPKIIISGMSIIIEAFYDDSEYLAGKSTSIILGDKKRLKALTSILNSKLISFWFSKYFNSLSMSGGYFNVGTRELEAIPIGDLTKNKFIKELSLMAEIMQFIKGEEENKYSRFFEGLINSMIYELYLSKEIESAGCEVLKHLANLKELKDDWSDAKKLAVVEEVYKELSNPKHPVSVAITKMQALEEVKVIEGRT